MSKKHNQKVRKKIEKNRQRTKVFKIVLSILAFLFVIIISNNVIKRRNLLKEEGEIGIAKVIRIKTGTKGTTTRETLAFLEYHIDGIKFEGTTSPFPNTKVGQCYEIKYVESNPKIFEVNFNRSVNCKD